MMEIIGVAKLLMIQLTPASKLLAMLVISERIESSSDDRAGNIPVITPV